MRPGFFINRASTLLLTPHGKRHELHLYHRFSYQNHADKRQCQLIANAVGLSFLFKMPLESIDSNVMTLVALLKFCQRHWHHMTKNHFVDVAI